MKTSVVKAESQRRKFSFSMKSLFNLSLSLKAMRWNKQIGSEADRNFTTAWLTLWQCIKWMRAIVYFPFFFLFFLYAVRITHHIWRDKPDILHIWCNNQINIQFILKQRLNVNIICAMCVAFFFSFMSLDLFLYHFSFCFII